MEFDRDGIPVFRGHTPEELAMMPVLAAAWGEADTQACREAVRGVVERFFVNEQAVKALSGGCERDCMLLPLQSILYLQLVSASGVKSLPFFKMLYEDLGSSLWRRMNLQQALRSFIDKDSERAIEPQSEAAFQVIRDAGLYHCMGWSKSTTIGDWARF